jgi:hypothetical protein
VRERGDNSKIQLAVISFVKEMRHALQVVSILPVILVLLYVHPASTSSALADPRTCDNVNIKSRGGKNDKDDGGCELIDKNRPLHMDIEWVMQGFEFSFTGFMTEFLGISSALVHMTPSLRLTQSSFRRTLHDLPVKLADEAKNGENPNSANMSSFVSLMFEEEARYFNKLFSREQNRNLNFGTGTRLSGQQVAKSKVFSGGTTTTHVIT